MQFLYSWAVNPSESLEIVLYSFFEHQDHAREYYSFAEELIHGVIEHMGTLDERIQSFATNWKFDRIAKVDLAIMRLAFYELFYRNDIPPVVSINEAIDLGKQFSNPDSKRFINGILDKVKEDLQRPMRSPAGEHEVRKSQPPDDTGKEAPPSE